MSPPADSMSVTHEPKSSEPLKVQLRPFIVDPEPSQEDLDDLFDQRTTCGWKASYIPHWVKEIQDGWRLMWFILLPGSPKSIGMISLALYDPNDLTLANLRAPGKEAGTRTEVSALFIYPEFRRKGYGEQAILLVEEIAKSLGSTIATMNTAAAGANMARYRKIGYGEYRERELRYPLHEILACGWTEEHCYAAFLEKTL